jgi:hypothetical protein
MDFLEKVINAYGKAITKRSLTYGLETELPFPKDVIRLAIAQILLTQDIDEEFRGELEFGYLDLEYFLPAKEYEIMKPYCVALSSTEKLVDSGKKEDLEKADQMFRETINEQVREIAKRIDERTQQRTRELEALRSIRGSPSVE